MKTDNTKMTRRSFVAGMGSVAAVAALGLAGCSSSGSDSSGAGSSDASTSGSALKDELHIAISANPPSLDPQSVNSNIVGGIGYHIYEPLFAMDEDYNPTPVLAESYEVSDDGTEYTIALRQGVLFHDGTEMTADDVVASLNRWVEVSGKASTLLAGTTFEKVDDYTVKMTPNEVASDTMNIVAIPITWGAIYPASVVEAETDEGLGDYIGTGPYKLVEWKQDQYVLLERNEDYQASPDASTGLAGVKNAATQYIYFDVVTESSTRIAGIQSGEYDIAEEIPTENYDELELDENLTLDTGKGGTLNLFLNTTEGIMANQDMRQAILAALNCDDIMLASFGNEELYEIDCGWCDPDDANWGSDAGSEYYNQNDPDKAAELLESAGYADESIVLVTTEDYPEMYSATLVVQEQLKNAGINADVETYEFETFMEHRSDPEQFSLFITSNSYNSLPIQLSVLDSSWAGLEAQEVTDGIEAIRFAEDQEAASAAWDDLQEFLYEYGAATVLGHYTGVYAMSVNVDGFFYQRFPIYWNVTVAE